MRKTEWHFWTIDQYNEEEQWLNKKAQEGWALTDAFAVRYVFESCQPGEYVYKIIFTDGIKGSQERYDFTAFLEENGMGNVFLDEDLFGESSDIGADAAAGAAGLTGTRVSTG